MSLGDKPSASSKATNHYKAKCLSPYCGGFQLFLVSPGPLNFLHTEPLIMQKVCKILEKVSWILEGVCRLLEVVHRILRVVLWCGLLNDTQCSRVSFQWTKTVLGNRAGPIELQGTSGLAAWAVLAVKLAWSGDWPRKGKDLRIQDYSPAKSNFSASSTCFAKFSKYQPSAGFGVWGFEFQVRAWG